MADPIFLAVSEIAKVDVIDLATANTDLIRKYIVYKFHQYDQLKIEDMGLWDAIDEDFKDFREGHFAQVSDAIWSIVKDYCYTHGYWLDHNYGPNRSCASIMYNTVNSQ